MWRGDGREVVRPSARAVVVENSVCVGGGGGGWGRGGRVREEVRCGGEMGRERSARAVVVENSVGRVEG